MNAASDCSNRGLAPGHVAEGVSADIRSIMALSPVIPVLTIHRLEHAAPLAASAMAAGGLRVLGGHLADLVRALEAISAMRAARVSDAIVGAGTLTRAHDFADCANAGAHFAVTPGLTGELIEAAAQSALPLLPGIMTPTELIAARGAGFTACKLFPAQQAGGSSRHAQSPRWTFPRSPVLSHRRGDTRQRPRIPGAAERAMRGRFLVSASRGTGSAGLGGNRIACTRRRKAARHRPLRPAQPPRIITAARRAAAGKTVGSRQPGARDFGRFQVHSTPTVI